HESIIMLINAAIVNDVGFPGSITSDQIVIAKKFAIKVKICVNIPPFLRVVSPLKCAAKAPKECV
ncbi:unnamed protein product, partial [marine sediment metagenome]